MGTTLPNLMLPLPAEDQAGKIDIINDALTRLDALVQLVVEDRTTSAPPSSPDEGQRWIVGASATGAWTGREGDVASWYGGWRIVEPQPGWIAYDKAGTALLVRRAGGEWDALDGAEAIDMASEALIAAEEAVAAATATLAAAAAAEAAADAAVTIANAADDKADTAVADSADALLAAQDAIQTAQEALEAATFAGGAGAAIAIAQGAVTTANAAATAAALAVTAADAATSTADSAATTSITAQGAAAAAQEAANAALVSAAAALAAAQAAMPRDLTTLPQASAVNPATDLIAVGQGAAARKAQLVTVAVPPNLSALTEVTDVPLASYVHVNTTVGSRRARVDRFALHPNFSLYTALSGNAALSDRFMILTNGGMRRATVQQVCVPANLSLLPTATTVADTDVMPFMQGTTLRRGTIAQITANAVALAQAAQATANAAIPSSQRGVASGVASLTASIRVPAAQSAKPSDFPTATTVAPTDLVTIEQAGTVRKAALSVLLDGVGGGSGGGSPQRPFVVACGYLGTILASSGIHSFARLSAGNYRVTLEAGTLPPGDFTGPSGEMLPGFGITVGGWFGELVPGTTDNTMALISMTRATPRPWGLDLAGRAYVDLRATFQGQYIYQADGADIAMLAVQFVW